MVLVSQTHQKLTEEKKIFEGKRSRKLWGSGFEIDKLKNKLYLSSFFSMMADFLL